MNEQTSPHDRNDTTTTELLKLAELYLRGGDLVKANELCRSRHWVTTSKTLIFQSVMAHVSNGRIE